MEDFEEEEEGDRNDSPSESGLEDSESECCEDAVINEENEDDLAKEQEEPKVHAAINGGFGGLDARVSGDRS